MAYYNLFAPHCSLRSFTHFSALGTSGCSEAVSFLPCFQSGSIDLLYGEHDWLRSFQMYLRLSAEIEPRDLLATFPTDETHSYPTTRDSFYYWLNSFLDSQVVKSANKNLFFDEDITEIGANGTEYAFAYHPLKACQFHFGYEFSVQVKENIRFVTLLNDTVSENTVGRNRKKKHRKIAITVR